MQPVRWAGHHAGFERFQRDLNEVLAFAGLRINGEGTVARTTTARTLTEAAQRTRRLRDELVRRGGTSRSSPTARRNCSLETASGAVFEATKGLAQRIRDLTGLDLDGAALVDRALSVKSPLLALNSLRTATEQNE